MQFLRHTFRGIFTIPILILVMALPILSLSPAQSANAADDCQYFPETSVSVCAKFLNYWKSNGGLAQQGYPISVVFQERNAAPPAGDGQIHQVQYFQRARFEEHLENS